MRIVTLTITYDMDDETKTLEAELQDWRNGNITIEDVELSEGATIKLHETQTP